MKPPSRRTFLRASAAIAGAAAIPEPVSASHPSPSYDEADAKLYDATKCIGCRACGRRCREYNELEPDVKEQDGIKWDMPKKLGANNFMVLQLYQGQTDADTGKPDEWSFIKRNCMHCNVPACATACPVGALRKTDNGPVEYIESLCIGCRYCMLACPYEVPRYEWLDRMPRVRKCTLCLECVEVCPTGALKAGKRKDLIAEAHQRIEEDPERYVSHVYGEHDAGGASFLILAGVPHDKLGLPKLATSVRSHYADPLMHSLPGWIVGLGLFLGGLHWMERKQQQGEQKP